MFVDLLEMVGFTGGAEGLRPSVKHRCQVWNWKEPTNQAELEAFIWLAPFLRMVITGRAEHVLVLKKAYLKQVSVKLESGKGNSVKRILVEKNTFDWGDEQRSSFEHIKKAVSDNSMLDWPTNRGR